MHLLVFLLANVFFFSCCETVLAYDTGTEPSYEIPVSEDSGTSTFTSNESDDTEDTKGECVNCPGGPFEGSEPAIDNAYTYHDFPWHDTYSKDVFLDDIVVFDYHDSDSQSGDSEEFPPAGEDPFLNLPPGGGASDIWHFIYDDDSPDSNVCANAATQAACAALVAQTNADGRRTNICGWAPAWNGLPAGCFPTVYRAAQIDYDSVAMGRKIVQSWSQYVADRRAGRNPYGNATRAFIKYYGHSLSPRAIGSVAGNALFLATRLTVLKIEAAGCFSFRNLNQSKLTLINVLNTLPPPVLQRVHNQLTTLEVKANQFTHYFQIYGGWTTSTSQFNQIRNDTRSHATVSLRSTRDQVGGLTTYGWSGDWIDYYSCKFPQRVLPTNLIRKCSSGWDIRLNIRSTCIDRHWDVGRQNHEKCVEAHLNNSNRVNSIIVLADPLVSNYSNFVWTSGDNEGRMAPYTWAEAVASSCIGGNWVIPNVYVLADTIERNDLFRNILNGTGPTNQVWSISSSGVGTRRVYTVGGNVGDYNESDSAHLICVER